MDPNPMTSPVPQHFSLPSVPMYYCAWPMAFNQSFVLPVQVPTGTQQDPCKKYKRTWSREQIEELYTEAKGYCAEHGKDLTKLDLYDFTEIAKTVCRSPRKCMNKLMEIQVSGTLRSGVWSPEEDEVLRLLLTEGKKKWGVIATAINQQFHKALKVRTGKQCKERWNNHINPLIDRGDWTALEDLRLLESHKVLGNRWSVIAKELKNRTDSSIKNRIKSLLNKERQNVVGFAEADLLNALIEKKTREVQNGQEPASPASRKPEAVCDKASFSTAVAAFQGFDFYNTE